MRNVLIVLMMILMCDMASAQSTTQPSVDVPLRPLRGGGLGARGRGPIDPAVREQTFQWASQNMPDLFRYAREYGRGRGGAAPIVNMIRARMLAMEEAPADSVVRERMRRNIATENQIGKYLIQMQTATPEERAELQTKIETAMRENVEGLLRERQERIDRLRSRLETEQRALDQERQRIDQIVNRRLMPFRNAMPEASPLPADPSITAPPAAEPEP